MADTNTFMEKIISEVSQLDVAWYLKEEIEALFKHLHYYKLKNIYDNIDALKEYLHFLDHHSTQQIHALEYDANKEAQDSEHNVLYYISQKGLELVGEHKLHQKIWENDFNLTYIMQGVKWFLLLTADEFCNASPTRMSINRILWKKQLDRTQQN